MRYTPLLASLFIFICACASNDRKAEPTTAKSENYLKTEDSHIYYETYGDPNNKALLLIHGSGGDLSSMSAQVEFFKDEFFVIAADNRTHGRSGRSDSLTYELMADDHVAVLHELKIENADIIGYSDGGIIALILTMNFPDITGKVISISPNLYTSEETIAEWDLEMTTDYSVYIDSMIGIGDTIQNWKKEKLHTDLLLSEPNIPLQDLTKIESPVLIIAADDDIIRLKHIVDIFEAIPNAQLNIFPGTTHFLIFDEVSEFNEEAKRFLVEPFERPTSKNAILQLINGEN